MQLPICGQTYQHPSRDVNSQRCVNMYPTLSGDSGRSDPVLLPTPGLKELVDCSGLETRAIIPFGNDALYVVVDEKLYKLTVNTDNKTATASQVGSLQSTTGPVYWARNPTQIMLVDNVSKGYIHTVSTDTFSELTDVDFTGGEQVVFFDSYFIYNTPDNSAVYSTAINDGTDVSALDITTAEAQPDKTVGLAVDKRELWIFGKESVEVWYNASNPIGFPLSRREGAFLDIGCGAKGSIQKVDNTLIWLDNRNFVVQANGYQPVIISTEAVTNTIHEYDVIEDAISYQYSDKGHIFYVLTFPTEGATWVFDASTNSWHQRAHYDANDVLTRHLSNCHGKYKGLEIIGAYNSGKIYIMSHDYRDDDGDSIHRIRTTQHHNIEFNQIGVDALEIHMETGKGKVTGQGSDPQIMLRYSNDGGHTWSNELWRTIGALGNYDTRIRWNRLGSSREWLFEFRITDPIDFAIIDASVDISGGLT